MTPSTFPRSIRGSWRIVFTGLILAVAGLVLALLRIADPATRTVPWHAASALLATGYGLCALVLYRRTRGWLRR